MTRNFSILISNLLLLFACTTVERRSQAFDVGADTSRSVTSRPFGRIKDGTLVSLYTLRNAQGSEMTVMNYGGIITALKVADRNGLMEDVTLGFDSLSQYENQNPLFGAITGRYANRIAKGRFTLDGVEYVLALNGGENHIHGGPRGFDKVVWKVEPLSTKENPSVRLTYLSKDGDQGYPGNLNVEVIYELTEDNEVKITYSATTDKKTIINLTQHSYFNLTGNVKRNILDHVLTIDAESYLPAVNGIPTGERRRVESTPFDFRTPLAIGARITEEQLTATGGYDHCWVFDEPLDSLTLVANVYEPVSGRRMEVLTTEPGVQLYCGNWLNGKRIGKGGNAYKKYDGLCLETQHFPDSPNQPSFPSVSLDPDRTFRSVTVFRFSAE